MARKINTKIYKFFAALAIYIIGVIASSAYLFMQSQQTVIEQYRRTITAAAYEAANDVGEHFHDKITGPNSVSKEMNRQNTENLTRLAKIMGVKYVYTVIRDSKGKIRITASSSSEELLKNKAPVKFYMIYKSAPEALKQVFDSWQVTYSYYNDPWGRFYSVYVPLKSANGKSYAACADIEVGDIAFNLLKILYQSLFLAGFLLLLAAPMLLAFNDYNKTQGGQLQEKQKQLAHAGRLTAMGEMAAGIAHEINQPLCVIRGYLELLKTVLKDNPEIKKQNLQNAFDVSIKSVERASGIINHMRSFVRLKSKGADPVNLAEPTDSALSFFNEQIRLHNIFLEKDYQPDIPKVMMDGQRFEQIAVNFISNARYAVDKKGEEQGRDFKKEIKIKIYYHNLRDKVIFEIIDNGIGMTKDVLKRCREPFYTTKDVEEGTGLGLGIVQDIVAEFGGRLEIESIEGKGSSFRAIFPPAHDS